MLAENRQSLSGSGIVSYLIEPERPSISKRAARRLIQQAIVLTGRDLSVRQHIREVQLATLWVLEDWNFEWTVNLDRGKVRFDRRPARAPFTGLNADGCSGRLRAGRRTGKLTLR